MKSGEKRTQTIINVQNYILDNSDKAPSIPKETAQTGNKKQKQELKPVDDGLLF